MTVKEEALPSSWTWATLGEIGYWCGGSTPTKSIKEYWCSPDIPWVTPKDMKIEDIHQAELSVSRTALKATNLSYIPEGSLLMVTRSGILSRTFPVAVTHCATTINQDIKALSPHAGIISRYLALACRHMEQRILATCSKQGTTVSSINTSSLQAFRIPVAPSKEQHRIVAKIEELFSEIDSGVESLKVAQAKLKTARQSLLKAAFEGKLTEQWRKENADRRETPEALLARIQAECEAHYQQKLTDWQQQVSTWEAAGKEGKKPRKPRALKALPPLTQEELSDLPTLPAGWIWSRIGDIGSLGTGITPLKKRRDFYENGKVPWVTSGALNNSHVTEPSGYITETALEETNLKTYPKGTLLVALYGEGKTRGKCSELSIEATINQAIAAIVQEGSQKDTHPYLKWFLFKNYNEIRMRSSGGVQPNLNLGIIETTKLPLCSVAEQQVICELLESRLSQFEQLEQTFATSLKQAEALKQSILKRAFAGKLVPQNPDDEPASELLERIRAEWESQPKAPRKQHKEPTP